MPAEKPGDWLAVAEKLADRILASRVSASDGSPTWIGPGLLPNGELRLQMPLNSQLYTGTSGVALFLAAMEKAARGKGYGEACRETLQPLRRLLAALVADPERAARLRLGIGGAVGLAGLVYAFSWAGRLLGDERLAAEAMAVTALFTPERIAADRDLDLLGGSAGAVLVLLGLGPAAGELAERCGSHLAAAQDPRGGWPLARHSAREALGGWAHGAAGGACALARLGAARGEPAFTAAAERALAYDRSLYSENERNWRDLRFAVPTFALGWCHGAPGIALSRLELAKVLPGSDELLREARRGLATTLEAPLLELDHLCCGNAGLAGILFAAAPLPAAAEWVEGARERLAAMLGRAARRGYFGFFPGQRDDSVFDPSLFKGASGIGLVLLRQATAEALPNPLILG